MAAQKQPYLCKSIDGYRMKRGFTAQAAFTEAFKPGPSQAWVYTDDPTDHYAVSEEGRKCYFVLINIPRDCYGSTR